MFLKTLQIKGFKSFADSATLNLEPGVTVVVGPNGSGKSNVVDAIGWVLGAQAPSTVRSSKMEDVIFAGSSKRPALGRAEVSLTIDNASGTLPIEFSEVTITRTLFRNGDSQYLLNGVPCRLLDIQDLLSDSGVGRQQHVIISQGQIDAVLNARPEDRRAIIEEAAGVLKYRRRKEKSERRLASTEANLLRIQDLLREVRRQLRPLERQADAARRHGAVHAELTALRVHLAGREIARLRTQLASSNTSQTELAAVDRDLRTQLAALDAAIIAIESRLSATGGDDLGDVLTRCESLRERAVGLSRLVAERRRGIDRDREFSADATVAASLDAELAGLNADLAALDGEDFAGDEAVVIAAEQALDEQRGAFDADWGRNERSTAARSEAAEIRGELAAVRSTSERTTSDQARVTAQRDAAVAKAARVSEERERMVVEHRDAEASVERLSAAAESAGVAREAADAECAAADEAASTAAAQRSAWTARVEALTMALDEARQRAGAERLAGLDGVVGTLLDVVQIDAGWEAAFEAAAAEALTAVVVTDTDVARAALEALSAGELSGAVVSLSASRAMPFTPAVGEPLRRHVRGTRPGVDGLLDALLSMAVVVDGGWVEALDAAIQHPEALVVTRSGDRFAAAGWRVGAGGSGATGSALEEAQHQATAAAEAAEAAADALRQARAALAEVRSAAAQADKARDQAVNRVRSLGDAMARLERDTPESAAELARIDAHLGELAERAQRQASRRAELEQRLPELEAAEAELAARAKRQAEARRALEAETARVRQLRSALDVRVAARDERRRMLESRIAKVDERLDRHQVERREAEQRRLELDARADATDVLAEFVTSRTAQVEVVLEELRAARRRYTERTRAVTAELEERRRERAALEARLTEHRERMSRAEIGEAEVRMRLEAATAACRHELDVEPEAAIEAPCPELAEGATPAARVRELEREIRVMGPINPLALEEFAALQERHEFLETQLDDIRTTRRELAKVIRAVDAEIVNVFAAAYADVSENFTGLFETLFPGGKGSLTLTDPSDLLSTGIEIEARPSGKNVRKLSLLSGGERSLTALAYLFAVFRSRPSPFYVMDEVEAALDDVNLHRFLALIAEFRETAQLVIVSHQKRTMESADVLYGVTMEPGGSSKVLSEKISA